MISPSGVTTAPEGEPNRRLEETVRRTQRVSVVPDAFPSSPSDGPPDAAHFRWTQRISVVSRRWSVGRSAFPSDAAHFRRTQRISVGRGAFPSSPSDGPSDAAHFRWTQRIFVVSRRRSVGRSAFLSYAAHFHCLDQTVRRTWRIFVGRSAFPSSRDDDPSDAAHFRCARRFPSSADNGPSYAEDFCRLRELEQRAAACGGAHGSLTTEGPFPTGSGPVWEDLRTPVPDGAAGMGAAFFLTGFLGSAGEDSGVTRTFSMSRASQRRATTQSMDRNIWRA
jgi:hypothetical protein